MKKFKEKLKKYVSLTFLEKKNIMKENVKKAREIAKRLKNKDMYEHPQYKINEALDW